MGQTRYTPKNWVFKSRFFFKVRQHRRQQLYLQYKVCWILYKMVGVPSFLQSYLCIKPPLQSPTKILSSTLVNFHFPIPSLLDRKIILKIPTNTPFLYTLAIFNLPTIFIKKYFPYLSILANSIFVKGPENYGVLWGVTVITGLTITDFLLFRLRKLVFCR